MKKSSKRKVVNSALASLIIGASLVTSCTSETEEVNLELESTNASLATPATDGIYTITNRANGRTMDIEDESNSNGADLQVWGTDSNTSKTNRQWEIKSVGDGYVRFKGIDSGKSIEISKGSNSTGANAQQWIYEGTTHQEWKIEPTSNGYFRIKSRDSGKSLRVSGSSNGSSVDQASYDGDKDQQWFFTEVGSSSSSTETETEETETSGTSTGDTPHEVLGLDRWKVTLPKDEGGDSDADEVYYSKSDNDYSGDDALTDYSDEFFYVSDSGNVVFECPADFDLPKTSAKTSNTRTELREMPYRSGDEDGWDAGGSTVREMNMKVRVMQTSSTRKLAFAQIHDFGEDNWDDLIRIQIQSDDKNATVGDTGKIYIQGDMAQGLDSEGVAGEDLNDRTILADYTLGDWMDIRVTFNNDTIRIYLDGNEVKKYTGADCASNYFKAGLYNQSMNSSSTGTGIVEIQSLSVTSNF